MYLIFDSSYGLRIGLFSIDNCLDTIEYLPKEVNSADLICKLIFDILHKHNIDPNQLKFVGIVLGPGFFTGIRIAIVVAKILRLALGIKIIGVDALRAQAYAVVNAFEDRSFSYILSSCDIGKGTPVIALLDNNLKEIIPAGYLDMVALEGFFDRIKGLDVITVGRKQDILKKVLPNIVCTSIHNVSLHWLARYCVSKCEQGDYLDNIVPIYGKEPDVKRKIYEVC